MSIPSLAMIPSGYKAGKLYSVLPGSGVGDFTVVRATEATRVNEEGLIETMGANVPRLDYSGGGCPVLLTEGQSTNLIAYSEDFNNAAWTKTGASVTSDAVISPDGTLNADLIYPLADASNVGAYTNIVSGSTGVISCFVKSAGKRYALLGSDNTPIYTSVFDLQEGAVVYQANNYTGTIESYSNGWYKITVAYINSSALNYPFIGVADNINKTIVADGTSGIYIYGFQYELNSSYPTSYIPTSGSAVTRNADQVYGAGDAATFNDSEGVLMAEISALANDLTFRNIEINDGTSSNRIILLYANISNTIRAIVFDGGAPSVIIDYSIPILNNNKFLFKYKLNDCSLWVNGFEVGTDTSATMPSGLNNLSFNKFDGGNPLYGNTKQVQYFNTVLTDSELEKLTSWTSFIEMAQALNYNII